MRGFFSHLVTQAFLGLLVLLVSVYLIAGLLHVPDRWAVVKVVGIVALLLMVVYSALVFVRERRLPWRLKAQEKALAGGAAPEDNAALKQLEEGFQTAFAELSHLKKGAGIFKSGGGDHLPWVIIIGPPGAGKTTALQNSGLRFTSLGRRVQGIGGTRNCVWWLAEEAVILDTAGRYSVQQEDHGEWLGFLNLLRRYRKGRPIDAVMLLVGLDEIEHLPPAELEEVALELQHRLDELIRHLGVRFPVHLVFSKFDRLDGFQEFFETLPRTEQDQAWGFSLDVDQLGEQPLGPVFAERYDALADSLSSRSTLRANELDSPERRLAALVFPHELARLRGALQSFTEILFEASRHRERPWLSAVYLISAAQEGSPLPGVRQAIHARLGVAQANTYSGTPTRTAWFVKSLFQRVLDQARTAARPTRDAIRSKRKQQIAVAAVLSLLCLTSSCFFTSSYLDDTQWLDHVSRTARQLTSTPGLAPSLPSEDTWTGELDRQAKLEALLGEREPGGLTGETWENAALVLRERIDNTWIKPLAPELRQKLERAVNQPLGEEGQAYADGYLGLKTDFVLRGKTCEGATPESTRSWIAAFLAEFWRQRWVGPPGQTMDLPTFTALEGRLSYFFEAGKPSLLQLDPALVDQTQRALKSQVPTPEVLFHLIVSNAGLTSIEPQLKGATVSEPGLMKAFTAEGCETFQASIDHDREWWQCVLGIQPKQLEVKDREKVFRSKYARARADWLNGLSFSTPAVNVEQVHKALAALDQPQKSELDQVFRVMAGEPGLVISRTDPDAPDSPENSGFVPGVLRYVREKLHRQSKSASERMGEMGLLTNFCASAKAPFGAYATTLKVADSPQAVALKAYKDSVKALDDRIQQIAKSASQDNDALALVQESMGSKGELFKLVQAREDLIDRLTNATPPADPAGLEQLLKTLESGIVGSLMPLAARGLDAQWKNLVYADWDTLLRARNPVPADDCAKRLGYLTEKFTPFITESLGIFYEGNSIRSCRLKTLFGQHMPLFDHACQLLNDASKKLLIAKCPAPPAAPGPPPAPTAPPPPPMPVRVETSKPTCSSHDIDWLEFDTGKEVYHCRLSAGYCDKPTPSMGTEIRIIVSRYGEKPFQLHRASSYESLLKLGIASGNTIRFPLGRSDCPDQAAIVTFPASTPAPVPVQAGPGHVDDPTWRNIALPPTLLQPARAR